MEIQDEEQSSITPKRPLLSRDRAMAAYLDLSSPLSDNNSRFDQTKSVFVPTTPLQPTKIEQSSTFANENHMFVISPPSSNRSPVPDDEDDNNNNTYVPIFTQRKAKPAPATTWKAPVPLPKSSSMLKNKLEPILQPPPELPPTPPLNSFQPAIRPRIPFNLSSTNTIDKQAHAYTIWLNSLFTPVEFTSTNSTMNQSTIKTIKSLAELNRWHTTRDRAREVFVHDLHSIVSKISADIDIDQSRINPKAELTFAPRSVNRQAILNFISSYNRIWFRLAMEVLFPINIENYQQMKISIEQYLIQPNNSSTSQINDNHSKKFIYNNNKTASAQIRLTIKNLIIIIIFLERAKCLRLIDSDPCLYNRDSKFKSTKESLDVLSRDFISSDTNLLRRLKLAGYEPTYKQTSLDEFHFLISNNENKLFDELKDGIRLTRCAQILLSSTNEQVARYDLSTKLKCPVVNLVHKLLNIDQAFDLLQTYGHVDLTNISNKDIMNGNKQRTLELLWRIFTICYLPKYLSPINKLNDEIELLTRNLSTFAGSSIEQQLINNNILPRQKQTDDSQSIIRLLIKWVQLICAHYKFWLYDLQESFADGRAFLYIISYYLPTLCDSKRDIKHLTTLATCQTREEHIQFNNELGQIQNHSIYERNVKSNFRLLEDCIKQFGTFSYDLIKYESYAKDLPDERCTILILAMLAHDLLFANNEPNDDMEYRHQTLFHDLKDKYSNQTLKEDKQQIEILREDSIISTDLPLEERFIHPKLSISSTTVTLPEQSDHLIPIIQTEEEKEIVIVHQSVVDTMNNDILNHLELPVEMTNDDDDENDADESFNSARSSSTTRIDHRRTSIAATMASITLDDFVELEKTIEKEENKTNYTSIFLTDETISSDVDSQELNKQDEACFADPANRKMIKETFTLFLSQQQSIPKYQQKSEHHAAEIVQAHWRGYCVRSENERQQHPIVSILNRLRSYENSSFNLNERMMKIVREFFDASPSSLTAYLHFLRDIEPVVECCVEIRYSIAQKGLLRLFFILMRCCNRSEPSSLLLMKILQILNLFTVKQDLVMKLIEKTEYVKDLIMLLLKYYQNNGSELFEQICLLLQAIVRNDDARRLLRTNKSFTEAIEYIYKRLFNKISNEDEKYRQLVRSTPKKVIRSKNISLNQSSILQPTPKPTRSSTIIENENVSKQNLAAMEEFMKVFYRD